jgi:hypothetical protein
MWFPYFPIAHISIKHESHWTLWSYQPQIEWKDPRVIDQLYSPVWDPGTSENVMDSQTWWGVQVWMNRPAGGSFTPAQPTGWALDLGVPTTYEVSSTLVCPPKKRKRKKGRKTEPQMSTTVWGWLYWVLYERQFTKSIFLVCVELLFNCCSNYLNQRKQSLNSWLF